MRRFWGLIVLLLIMCVLLVGQTQLLAEQTNATLHLKGYEFKSLDEVRIPAGLEKQGYTEGERGYFIVRFAGPIQEAWKNDIKKTGAILHDYVPDFAFIVEMTNKMKQQINSLPFITDVIVYQPFFKFQPALVDEYGVKKIKDNQVEGIFFIQTFTKDFAEIETYIQNSHGNIYHQDKELVKVKVNRAYLTGLAQLNNVKFIEEAPVYELLNDVAKGYIDVDDLWNLGYTGAGQIVGVCDTGLDTGVNDSTMHKDFQGRIISLYALGRSTADDPHGHGTHVSGSVLGDGTNSNGQIKGMAPAAQLVLQSVLDSNGGLGGLPNDLNDLFAQAYADGARIHTNSWGASVYGAYNTDSAQVDQFVNNNRDMIILFAASNDGPTLDSIGAPGTAKNCITVGASENYRPEKGSYADDPNSIASFSSRGWTDDGRIKPDIVAPGTWILSCKSSVAPESNYWEGYNSYYAYMGGTSMATPITAGSVAVAREYIMTNWNHTPSASLMKAIMINGATDLGYGYPSRDQGWGRVSLVNSLSVREINWLDETTTLATGENMVYTYTVESTNTPLKVSLVWTDVPGSTTASKALVNDLDLKVTSPDGTVYYGNDFSNPYNTAFDRVNNVENVFVETPFSGTWTVEVLAYNIPDGPQNYSLVVSGDFGTPINDPNPPTVAITSPAEGAELSGTVTITADATDDVAVSRVDFYADGIYLGRDVDSPYSYDWATSTVDNGSHVLTAIAFDIVGNNTTSTPVNVTTNNQITQITETFTGFVDRNATRSQNHYIEVAAPGTITLELTWDTTADLDMFLYNPAGTEVARAYTTQKPETITYEATEVGTFKITVDAYSGSGNYTLTVTYPGSGGTTPPSSTTATLDETGTLKRNKPILNYTIDVTSTDGSIDVNLSWLSSVNNLDVFILDPTGTQVAAGTSLNNPEVISYSPITSTGTYTIRVQAINTLLRQETFHLVVTYPVIE